MKNVFYNNGSIRMPRRSAAEKNDEYTVDSKGIEECPICKNVYYLKRWMSSIDEVKEKNPEATVERVVMCPACTMARENLFEGEIVIENIPETVTEDLHGLIKNFSTYAIEADPQDRIITVEDSSTTMRITTTENQLAERLSKKIKSAMKNVTLAIKHSKEPYEVTRVHLVFA